MPRHSRRPPRRRNNEYTADALNRINAAIARTGLLTPRDRLAYLAPVNFALSSFRLGRGALPYLVNLVDALNIAAELCKRRICNDRAPAIRAGLLALVEVCERGKERSDWSLTPELLEALEEAVFIHTVQMEHCSCGEFDAATQAVIAMTRQAAAGHRTPGCAVVDPLHQGANASEAAALHAAST